jgi:hypothetical protein
MDESIVKHLEQPQVGTLKLSEAIREGLWVVQEDLSSWKFCALGAAFAGVHGRQMNDHEALKFVFSGNTAHAIADVIGFPRDMCERAHKRHCGGEPAARIADWLESIGY